MTNEELSTLFALRARVRRYGLASMERARVHVERRHTKQAAHQEGEATCAQHVEHMINELLAGFLAVRHGVAVLPDEVTAAARALGVDTEAQ